MPGARGPPEGHDELAAPGCSLKEGSAAVDEQGGVCGGMGGGGDEGAMCVPHSGCVCFPPSHVPGGLALLIGWCMLAPTIGVATAMT